MALSDYLQDRNRYDLEFNGELGSSYGVIFYNFPKITYGPVQYTTTSVNGRCGDLLTKHRGRGNAIVECTFAMAFENIHERFRTLRNWLNGRGKLTFSESPDSYYEVLLVESPVIQRQSRTFGLYTVKFIVYPYEFLKSGRNEMTTISNNPYSECMPIYTIGGTGDCILNVNGKEFKAIVNGTIIIDSRRMIAYDEDMQNLNTKVSGNYEDLILPSGNINISITDGFSLKLQPNWGYFL